jgi:3-oxoacyl-[acyl-carrier-protein] synthase-3
MSNNTASIIGTGSSVPDDRLTNEDLEEMVDTSDEWITKRTGIKERRIASDGEATSDLALEASEEALQEAPIDRDEIDAIVVGTITPDNMFPSSGCHLQRKLGLEPAPSFDVSAACSGYIYALTTGWSFICSGFAEHVLVLGAEVLSTVTDYQDRSMCVLFGDGAGATVLGPGNGRHEVLYTNMYAEGDGDDLMVVPAGGSRMPTTTETVENRQHYMKMEGRKVFKFAVNTLCDMIQEAADAEDLDVEDLSLVVPHQMNQRIMDKVCSIIGLPEDRMYSNIDQYGNTSGASIPLALDEAVEENRLSEGDYLVLTSVGAGLTWGTTLIEW